MEGWILSITLLHHIHHFLHFLRLVFAASRIPVYTQWAWLAHCQRSPPWSHVADSVPLLVALFISMPFLRAGRNLTAEFTLPSTSANLYTTPLHQPGTPSLLCSAVSALFCLPSGVPQDSCLHVLLSGSTRFIPLNPSLKNKEVCSTWQIFPL